jgi:hypothetical protein
LFTGGAIDSTKLRFLASRKAEGSFGEIVTAGLVADFPPMTITPFDTERFFLVRFENGVSWLGIPARRNRVEAACPASSRPFHDHDRK